MKSNTIQKIIAANQAKKPIVVITDLENGKSWINAANEPDADQLPYPSDLHVAAQHALAQDKPILIENDQRTYFLNPYLAPLRLIVVGAVHIAQPLCQIAIMNDYNVTIIDPRTAFATQERFPNATLIKTWPDEAFAALQPDNRTALVTLTHDPKLDDPALDMALHSNVFYIGALGSRKTQAARLKRLASLGHQAANLERISGPVGLDIGSKSPAEIALSIMAEMTCVLRKKRPYEDRNEGA